tara:strand:- start:223 stop:636 length:414 start_codon:yes stop_codon:yes gene_type:complete
MYYLKRFVASIIDSFFIGIIASIFLFVTNADTSNANIIASFGEMSLISIPVLGWFIGIFYFGFMESSSLQASIGKMVMSLKVVNESGNKISTGKSLLRNLNKLLSYLPFLAGFILIFVRKDNQALHDWFIDVIVVDN